MEDVYISGFVVAFWLGVLRFILTFSAANNQKAKNFEKVGTFLSVWSGRFDALTPPSKLNFFFLAAYCLVIAPFGSWISVSSAAWGFFRWLSDKFNAPQTIKDFEFKVTKLNLTKPQMLEALDNISRFLNLPPGRNLRAGLLSFVDRESPYQVNLFDSTYPEKLTIYPHKKQYTLYSRVPEDTTTFKSTFEYRFKDKLLFQKCIQDFSDGVGERLWTIKDGTAQEKDISSNYVFTKETTSRMIESAKNASNWHRVERFQVKYFLMLHHPETFGLPYIQETAAEELQSLRNSLSQFKVALEDIGGNLNETENGFNITTPKCKNESEQENIQLKITKIMSLANLSNYNLWYAKKIETDLLALAEEKLAA